MVHKFGGSSLADAKCFVAIKSLLRGKNEIVVVSAIKDVTSTLQAMLDAAKAGDDFLQALTDLEKLHLTRVTVCAGLPIINTLQDIVKTGDEVLAIEGVVSGTLSFVFSELAKGRLFSEIVLEAKQRGYTETDPREDLSGKDVVRKFVCLAREIGHDVSIADVKVQDLIAPELKSCNFAEFMQELSQYDDQWSALITAAKSKDEKLCCVGTIKHDGEVEVSLKAFPMNHPLARLKGADNMLIFNTRRYSTQPLVIQGPGAGAEVTAAGVFADILRLIASLS